MLFKEIVFLLKIILNKNFGKRKIFSLDIDPTVRHTVWSCSIGLGFNWLAIYACNQSQVQRYLSVPTVKIARRYTLLNIHVHLKLN